VTDWYLWMQVVSPLKINVLISLFPAVVLVILVRSYFLQELPIEQNENNSIKKS